MKLKRILNSHTIDSYGNPIAGGLYDLKKDEYGYIELVYPVINPFFYLSKTKYNKINFITPLSVILGTFNNKLTKQIVYGYLGINSDKNDYKLHIVPNDYENSLTQYKAVLFCIENKDVVKERIKRNLRKLYQKIYNNVYDLINENIISSLILDKIIVPPPEVRPVFELRENIHPNRIEFNASAFMSDLINNLYIYIFNINKEIKRLKEYENYPEVVLIRFLQLAVENLFDNKLVKIGDNIKFDLLKDIYSKENIFVELFTSKTVDFSGRSVIVPNPELKIDEIEVSSEIIKELYKPDLEREIKDTFSERAFKKLVNNFYKLSYFISDEILEDEKKKLSKTTKITDLKKLQELFGDELRRLERLKESFNKLKQRKSELKIEEPVENSIKSLYNLANKLSFDRIKEKRTDLKKLNKDDIYNEIEKITNQFPEREFILIRQPTLHRHNIQSFKLKRITNTKTIHIPNLVVSGYGADFDGDTMAIFLLHNIQFHQKLKEYADKNDIPRKLINSNAKLKKNLLLLKENKSLLDSYLNVLGFHSGIWTTLTHEAVLGIAYLSYLVLFKLDEIKLKYGIEKFNLSSVAIKIRTYLTKKDNYSSYLDFLSVEDLDELIKFIIEKNKILTKKDIDELIIKKYNELDREKFIDWLNRLAKTGYYYATLSGYSFTLDNEKLKDYLNEIDMKLKYDNVSQWIFNKKTKKFIQDEAKTLEKIYNDYLKEVFDKENFEKNLNFMDRLVIQSGARAKLEQYQAIYLPKLFSFNVHNKLVNDGIVKSSLYKGLCPNEYFIHTSSARRNLLTGKFNIGMRTNLARVISYALRNLKFSEEQCSNDKESYCLFLKDNKICSKHYSVQNNKHKEGLIGFIIGQTAGEKLVNSLFKLKHIGIPSLDEFKRIIYEVYVEDESVLKFYENNKFFKPSNENKTYNGYKFAGYYYDFEKLPDIKKDGDSIQQILYLEKRLPSKILGFDKVRNSKLSLSDIYKENIKLLDKAVIGLTIEKEKKVIIPSLDKLIDVIEILKNGYLLSPYGYIDYDVLASQLNYLKKKYIDDYNLILNYFIKIAFDEIEELCYRLGISPEEIKIAFSYMLFNPGTYREDKISIASVEFLSNLNSDLVRRAVLPRRAEIINWTLFEIIGSNQKIILDKDNPNVINYE